MRSSRSIRPAPRRAFVTIFRELELVVEAIGHYGCEDGGGKRLSGCCGLQRCGTSLSQRSHVTWVFPNRGGSFGEDRAEIQIYGCGVFLGFDLGVKSSGRGCALFAFFFSATEIKIRRWPLSIISHSPMPCSLPSLSRRPSIPLMTSLSRSPPSSTLTSS